MASGRRVSTVAALLEGIVILLVVLPNIAPGVEAWGEDGHAIICEIAKSLLNTSAVAGVAKYLPESANGNMSSVCSWADEVRYHKGYTWSAPLHFIDTPDQACDYLYSRDCFGDSKFGFCAAGAINNYTAQLTGQSAGYNLTEALLFLMHFVGDIHQPLHCGFKGDLGGNTIDVKWYNLSTNLHHVWDTSIITTTDKDYFHHEAANLTTAILANITSVWRNESSTWATCTTGSPPCTDTYATESVTLACSEAYANVNGGEVVEGDLLADPYFDSRYPVVEKRLATGGVRLAAILNTVFP